jgi:glycogen synthase
MKILFSSHVFHPSVGGIESVSKILTEKFAEAGHSVHVSTATPGDEIADADFRVSRRPSLIETIRLLRWSDLLFQNNISLRNLIPALFLRKRVIVAHHTWIQDVRGKVRWRDRIKYALLPLVKNVAISQAVADRLNVTAVILGNPYNDDLFRVVPGVSRDETIAFLGRLVSDKGVDVLMRALKLLQQDGLSPDLTIIGGGPEEENLRRLRDELGLNRQVNFAGPVSGEALVKLLNQHRILAVPSRWAEPFGLVALEGIACGCVVVGSERGGLKEAIGPCGLTFENGNERALAAALKDLLTDSENEAKLRGGASAHLARFRADAVASAYLQIIEKV